MGNVFVATFSGALKPHEDPQKTITTASDAGPRQGRLSLLCWTQGLDRGLPNAICKMTLEPWHVVALQEASAHLSSDILCTRYAIAQHQVRPAQGESTSDFYFVTDFYF